MKHTTRLTKSFIFLALPCLTSLAFGQNAEISPTEASEVIVINLSNNRVLSDSEKFPDTRLAPGFYSGDDQIIKSGLDAPEHVVIRAFFDIGARESDALTPSDKLIFQATAAKVKNDKQSENAITDLCRELLAVSPAEYTSENAHYFSDKIMSISDQSNQFVVTAYEDMLNNLSISGADYISESLFNLHTRMSSNNIDLESLRDRDPGGFVERLSNRCNEL